MSLDVFQSKINTKGILRFVIPSMVMMLFMSIYTIVDGLVASNFIDYNAFASVNLFYPLLGVVIAIATMLGSGGVAFISSKIGEKKILEARKIMTAICLICFVMGTVISIGFLGFLDPILKIIGTNQATFDYCKSYAIPIIICFPFIMLQILFQFFYAANGTPKLGLFTTILGGVLNIVLDLFFTLVLKMGIVGISVASVTGYLVSALIGILYFSIKKEKLLYFTKPKINIQVLFKILVNGSSEMITNLSVSITTLIFNLYMMNYYGENGVAAIAVILSLDYVFISSSLGFAAGVAPLISYNHGQKNQENIKKLFKINLKFCLILGIITTSIVIIFRNFFISIFADSDTVIYTMALSGIIIFSFSYLLKSSNIYYSSLFTALEDGKISAIIALMRTLIFTVISIVLLVQVFGIDAIWYSILVAESMSFLFSWFLIYRKRQKYQYF